MRTRRRSAARSEVESIERNFMVAIMGHTIVLAIITLVTLVITLLCFRCPAPAMSDVLLVLTTPPT